MRRPLAIVLLLLAAVATWWLLREKNPRAAPESPSVKKNDASTLLPDSANASSTRSVTLLPVAAESSRLSDPQGTAQEDLAVLVNLLQEYRRTFGSNPVGDNSEVTAALRGGNAKNLGYLAADVAPLIDGDGCLTDRWGNPYFFHALSGKVMEIRSAGPDGRMHTADDLRSE